MSVYLEGACGHEFECPDDMTPPSEVECPEHGRTALWAQRLEPKTENPIPLRKEGTP